MFKFLLCNPGYEGEWYVAETVDIPDVEPFTYETQESCYARRIVDITYKQIWQDNYERVESVRYEPTWEKWCVEGHSHRKEDQEEGDYLYYRTLTESGWLKSFDTWEQVQAFIVDEDAQGIVPTHYTFPDGSRVWGLVL